MYDDSKFEFMPRGAEPQGPMNPTAPRPNNPWENDGRQRVLNMRRSREVVNIDHGFEIVLTELCR